MVIQSQRDMAGLVKIGKIVGMTLQRMLAEVHPGITTGELDALGASLLKKEGAHSAPIVMYKFPGWTCISVNDEAAHGIPGKRVVQIGDLVNIDVSAELDGYYADTAATIAMVPVTGIKQRLAEVAHSAMEKGISVATAGNKVNEIGRAMESVVRGAGFSVIRDLPGHGVGRKLHELPSVPGFYNPRIKDVLKEGMVLTVEPFVSTKAKHIFTDNDGWTLKTPDGSPAAQYEHTLVITKGDPIRITQVV